MSSEEMNSTVPWRQRTCSCAARDAARLSASSCHSMGVHEYVGVSARMNG